MPPLPCLLASCKNLTLTPRVHLAKHVIIRVNTAVTAVLVDGLTAMNAEFVAVLYGSLAKLKLVVSTASCNERKGQ